MKIWWLLLPTLLAQSSPSRADGRPPSCAERQSTALGQVACELTRALPTPNAPVHVSVAGVTSTLRLERGEQLAERLARAVAGELGEHARVATPTDTRVDRLVLRAELNRDRFAVNAELVHATGKFWERFRPGQVGAVERAHAARPLDAELASYLPPVPLVLTRVDKARLDEPSVALACGDVEGDGGLQIVSVGRRRVQLGRVASGRFQSLRSRAWSELSEVSPRPLRDPIASASVDAARKIRLGSSDRAEALTLNRELEVVTRYSGLFPWPGAGCVPFTPNGLGEARSRCDQKPARDAGGPVDAIAGAVLAKRDGSAFEVFAARKPSGELWLEQGGARRVVDPSVGAQIALADLNGDGQAELISSSDTLDPSSDAVLVRSIGNDGKLHDAFRVPTPNGVRAVGVCPPMGDLLAPLLIATGDELWVVR